MLLECPAHTCHGAACAHSSHEDIHLSVSILPDFLTRGALVHVGIGWVDKLSQDDCAGCLILEPVGLLYGSLHALGA